MISDLKTPAANTANAVRGLYINGGTTINAIIIHLSFCSGAAGFGSSGIYTNSTPTITLINNLVVTIQPNQHGSYCCHRRSSNSLVNLSASTNYNSYYAGTLRQQNVFTMMVQIGSNHR